MVRKIFSVLFLMAMFLGTRSYAQDCVYTDASAFPLYGQIDDDVETRYERLPVSLKEVSRPDILRLGRKSAGMFIRFRSNTTSVWVKWAALYDNEQNHMTDTGTRGLDLYALVGDEWKAVAPVRPENTGLNVCRVIKDMEPVEREYMLYLPLYDGLKSLEIGVDAGAFIDQPAVDSPSTEKPVKSKFSTNNFKKIRIPQFSETRFGSFVGLFLVYKQ